MKHTCLLPLQPNSLSCSSHWVSHKRYYGVTEAHNPVFSGRSLSFFLHLLNMVRRRRSVWRERHKIQNIKARNDYIFPLQPLFFACFLSLCLYAAPLLPVFSLSSCSLFLQAQSNLPLPFPQGNKGRNANDYSNPSCHRNAVMWLEQACIDHNKEVDQEPALERAVARLTGASVHFTQIQTLKIGKQHEAQGKKAEKTTLKRARS